MSSELTTEKKLKVMKEIVARSAVKIRQLDVQVRRLTKQKISFEKILEYRTIQLNQEYDFLLEKANEYINIQDDEIKFLKFKIELPMVQRYKSIFLSILCLLMIVFVLHIVLICLLLNN